MKIFEFIVSNTLDFILIKSEHKRVEVIKVSSCDNTPYFRLYRPSIEETIDTLTKHFEEADGQIFIYNKKNLFHFSVDKRIQNLLYYSPDYQMSLWQNNKMEAYHEKKLIPNLATHIDALNKLSFDFYVYNEWLIPNHNEVLKACSILSTDLLLKDDTIIAKNFNPYTVTGRLHDIGGNTVAMQKDDRNNVVYDGIKIELDIDGFHLRIIDKLLDLNILPKEEKAIEKIHNEVYTSLDRKDFKKEIYKSLYSESFHIQHLFFEQVKSKYKTMRGALNDTRNFNYVIQSHEVLEMSKIINNIPPDSYFDITFYLYDGLIIDAKPNKINDILLYLKSLEYPFKIKMLDREKFLF
jgi:hypothetical protein